MTTAHHTNAKATISLLIALLALAVLLIFYFNLDVFLQADTFNMFVTLATVGMGLMVGLLYLVNKTPHTSKTTKKTAKKAKKK